MRQGLGIRAQVCPHHGHRRWRCAATLRYKNSRSANCRSGGGGHFRLCVEKRDSHRLLPTMASAEGALMRSQSGPLASIPFVAFPTCRFTQFGSQQFRTFLLRRLHLPVPLSTRSFSYFGHDLLWPRSVFGIFEAEEGRGVEGWGGRRVGGPKPRKRVGRRAQNYACFSLSRCHFRVFFFTLRGSSRFFFLSLGVFSWNFGGVFNH